jgi:hypothetical protein
MDRFDQRSERTASDELKPMIEESAILSVFESRESSSAFKSFTAVSPQRK